MRVLRARSAKMQRTERQLRISMNDDKTPVTLSRQQETWKFFQFVFFSISAGLIQILFYTLLSEWVQLSRWQAYLPSLIASVLWNFTVNRRFTFKSVSNVPVAMMKVFAYYLVFTPVSTWWVNALNGLKPAMDATLWEYSVLGFTMLVNFVTEFCIYRFWVYRTSINTSEAGKREQEMAQRKK
jgi:putative flippase GtrA